VGQGLRRSCSLPAAEEGQIGEQSNRTLATRRSLVVLIGNSPLPPCPQIGTIATAGKTEPPPEGAGRVKRLVADPQQRPRIASAIHLAIAGLQNLRKNRSKGHESAMITVGMNYQVIPGKEQLFVDKFNAVIAALQQADGHQHSVLWRDTADESSFLITSEWNDEQAFRDFVTSEAFRAVTDWGKESILSGRPQHKVYKN
jgi:heme-degrading monooxygenase HmoA